MGEHGTWFDYLFRFEWFQSLMGSASHALGRSPGDDFYWKFMMFDKSYFTLSHVFVALVVLLFVMYGAYRFKSATKGGTDGLVPPKKFGLFTFFEMLTEFLYNLVEGGMGAKNARRFFPLIGTLWLFIWFGNLAGLVPGFISSTDTLKTNVALALVVFFASHYYGIKEHGLAYFKHFLGPIPALAPLMLPIEIVSHLARPVSLALRLMGNMVADHKVIFSFFTLVPFFVPLPFYFLGLIVCTVQALVFCMLSMVYLSTSIEHEEH